MEAARIEFLPRGKSKKARDNAKGHLLEQLVAEYLKASGYPDVELNVERTGTELDVVGRAGLTRAELIVSCKCQHEAVSPGPLKELAMDVLNQADRDPRAHGLFVAIPGFSGKAWDYYRSELLDEATKRVRLCEEADLIRALCEQADWHSPETVTALVEERGTGKVGEVRLLYGEKGAHWALLVLDEGERTPSGFYILAPTGQLIVEDDLLATISRGLRENSSDLAELAMLNEPPETMAPQPPDRATAARAHVVTPGKGWFDYKFPAPPDCFAGRNEEVEAFRSLVRQVRSGESAERLCIVTGLSGIGKSSLILKMLKEAHQDGARGISVSGVSGQSRGFLTASVLRLIETLDEDAQTGEAFAGVSVGGTLSLPEGLYDVGERARECGITPVLFFDQFEAVLHDLSLAEATLEMALAVEESQANLVLGFAWKTDFWWQDEEIAFVREALRKRARSVPVKQFGPDETNVLLRALEARINAGLMTALEQEVREFSRGYPWLLKKVCWHINQQIADGAGQRELVERQLDLRNLFEADIQSLDEDEKDSLRKLASVMPADSRTLAERFPGRDIGQLLNKFVDMRLLLREGDVYNVYHDIFAEFLRTDRLPIDEVYLLRTRPRRALKAIERLAAGSDKASIEQLASDLAVAPGSLSNYLRDLRAIGVVDYAGDDVWLPSDIGIIATEDDLSAAIRQRLVRNTCTKRILELWDEAQLRTLGDVIAILQGEFPAVAAQQRTWERYASTMVAWLNSVGATGDGPIQLRGLPIARYLIGAQSGAQQPEGYISGTRRLIKQLRNKGPMSKEQIAVSISRSETMVEKSLVDARLMGLCERLVDGRRRLTADGELFADSEVNNQRAIVRKRILDVPVVAYFYETVATAEPQWVSARQVVSEINTRKGKELHPTTTASLANILANWLEFAELIERSGGRCRIPAQCTLL